MHAINIICSAEVKLSTIKELSATEILFRSSDDNSINTGKEDDTYIAVTDIDADTTDTDDTDDDFKIVDMYKGEQRSLLLKHFVTPKVFLIQYERFENLKEFIEKISSLNLFIDNDKGKLLTIYDLRAAVNEKDFI